MKLSIILPTYNEAENIAEMIRQVEEVVLSKYSGEVLVVDSSSPDGTKDIAEKLNEKYKNIRVVSTKKEGLGAALRRGYNEGTGDILLSMDADLSFDIQDVFRMLKKMESGFGLVVASRYGGHGKYEKAYFKTVVKAFISKYGNKLVRLITGLKVSDYSLNFRAIKKNVWNKIHTVDKTNSVMLEMILKTHYAGYKVGEIEVIFKDRVAGVSKLNLIKEPLKFFIKLIQMTVARMFKRD